MRVRAVLLAAMLALASAGVRAADRAADLVVWWEEGFNPEEDAAVREIIVAFQQKAGKTVELTFHSPSDLETKTLAAVAAGQPPDFLFGLDIFPHYSQWSDEGRLADLSNAIGPLADLFFPDALARASMFDATTGRRGLHALPMGRVTNHLHVWRSLLERAGFTLADIPKEWALFWSFWCDKVQPAVRKATGRDDIYGVGLPMSGDAYDTLIGFFQFVDAYQADYVTNDGRLVIDEPEVRAGLIKALDGYTTLYRKGCVPPNAGNWTNRDNNNAFLAQRVIMTANATLSVPNALKATRPEDYTKNAVTLDWPDGAHGQPLAIYTGTIEATVFRDGGHVAVATEFVRFLVREGWLAHWLNFAKDRLLPPMPALLEGPFWLDPGDPHRMAAAMQFLARPRDYWEGYAAISGNWRHDRVYAERVWPKAVHRVATQGISPEQAVDEAMARTKQILGE